MSATSSPVLFDWDGTLVDTRTALLAAWHDVTEAVLGERYPVTDADIAVALSRRGHESFPLLSDDPAVVAELAARFSPAYLAHHDLVVAFPGIADVLDALAAAGRPVGIVTSKTRDRWAADAARTGLDGRFDVVVCAEDVTAGKPHPEAVHLAAAGLGVAAPGTTVVGDAPADIAAGIAAGAATIAVSWGFFAPAELVRAGADTLVDTPRDLVATLQPHDRKDTRV